MAFTTKDFTSLVRDQAAAIQASARGLVDLTVGSILLAVSEATASLMLWLQSIVLALLLATRAATSEQGELDSWMADFGFDRLAAQFAVGLVTFARFSTAGAVTIPAGSTVQSADGSQQYVTTADATMGAGIGSIQASVVALVAGAAGNAAIGQVSVITGSLPGVDTCTNVAAFTVGADAESDPAYRARFRVWLAGLSKATPAAIAAAVTSLRPGITCTITENITYAGTVQQGSFFVVVDDGTGAPSGDFLTSIGLLVEAVRGLTIAPAVFAPVVEYANVSMLVAVAPGYDLTATKALAVAAVTNYINTLSLGASLPYLRLAQVAFDASPGITNVSSLLLNGGAADLAATSKQVIKAGTVTA